MRIRLPESERTRTRRPGAALASAVLHGVVIAVAANATAGEPRAEPAPPATVLVYRAPPAPMPPDVGASAARAGATGAAAAPRRAAIALPSAPAPDLALPGPLAVELTLPGAGVAASAFDAGAAGPIGAASGAPGAAGGATLDARHVERAATPLREVRPRYPDALRARSAGGEVLARYVVDSAGRVSAASVEIVEASDPLFAAAVRDALRDARFRAAEAGGRPVAQLVEQRFVFTLRDR